jgi:hypothetical protein
MIIGCIVERWRKRDPFPDDPDEMDFGNGPRSQVGSEQGWL